MPDPDHQTRGVLMGTLWIVLLTALALGTFFLDELVRVTERPAPVVVLMEEAPNVRRGQPVWVAGYAVGTVRNIDFLPPGTDTLRNMAVTVEIPREQLAHLPRDSYARLRQVRPLADPTIDLVPGRAGTPLQPGDTVYAVPSISSAALMANLAGARAAFDSLRRSAEELTRVADPEAAARRLESALAGIEAVRGEAGLLLAGMREGPLRQALGPEGFAADVEVIRARMDTVRVALAARGRDFGAEGRLRPAVRDAAASFERVSRNLERLEAMIEQGGGLPGRLERDTAIVAAIHELQLQLDSLVAEIKRDPLRFLF